jgi:5-methylcytosine-specific restriction endonuclease McrA
VVARRRGAGPSLVAKTALAPEKGQTLIQRNAALKENNGKCVFCGKKATEVDHSIPKSKNGDTTKENLQPACQHCNRQKGAKTSDEYQDWKRDRKIK